MAAEDNGGSGDYLEYVRSLKNYETTLNSGTSDKL